MLDLLASDWTCLLLRVRLEIRPLVGVGHILTRKIPQMFADALVWSLSERSFS